MRGGSWNNNDNNCRVANRNRNNPDNRNNNNGFRCLQYFQKCHIVSLPEMLYSRVWHVCGRESPEQGPASRQK
ncbi:MAG: hypothetical protein H8D27_04145 [Chlorobium phaeobacteroides]|nr:hypothetical protein [Chlorobium phaeobacteroides]